MKEIALELNNCSICYMPKKDSRYKCCLKCRIKYRVKPLKK